VSRVEFVVVAFTGVVTERLVLVAEAFILLVTSEAACALPWLMFPERERFAEATNWLGESKLMLLPVIDP
jgi:hypothetical protein